MLKTNMSWVDPNTREYRPAEEFVAIAEGIDLPLYIFTYNVEMTQFVWTDITRSVD